MSESLTRKDFDSGVDVRWCPGCGDYAILASVQKVLPELGVRPENTVFISGIGCSSRFPYYLNTYGFHTIHGRAPTLATGLKLTRPELSVWVVTGDGDGLSIGANHLLHLFRRNLDITVLLFNNRIYGLTKGQYSPTSEQNKITKTTPYGSLDTPLSPVAIALAAGASFVARAIDVDAVGLQEVLLAAARHPGTSFVEIYQNCNVFNDGAFANISEKAHRSARTIVLRPGQPLLFGAQKEKGLSWTIDGWQVVPAASAMPAYAASDLGMALQLNALTFPEFPVATGIFYQQARPTYEARYEALRQKSIAEKGVGDLKKLFYSGNTWST